MDWALSIKSEIRLRSSPKLRVDSPRCGIPLSERNQTREATMAWNGITREKHNRKSERPDAQADG